MNYITDVTTECTSETQCKIYSWHCLLRTLSLTNHNSSYCCS